jgi:hypothetical protein
MTRRAQDSVRAILHQIACYPLRQLPLDHPHLIKGPPLPLSPTPHVHSMALLHRTPQAKHVHASPPPNPTPLTTRGQCTVLQLQCTPKAHNLSCCVPPPAPQLNPFHDERWRTSPTKHNVCPVIPQTPGAPAERAASSTVRPGALPKPGLAAALPRPC